MIVTFFLFLFTFLFKSSIVKTKNIFLFYFNELHQALELKKLQTPLYEEFRSISNAAIAPAPIKVAKSKVMSDVSNVTSSIGRSASQAWRRFSMVGSANVASPGSHTKYRSNLSGAHCRPLQEIQPSELNESEETLHDAELESSNVRYVSGA